MSILLATYEALILLVTGDTGLWQVIATSLGVAICALLLAAPLALMAAYSLAIFRFAGRDALLALIHALLATPTVVVGLVLYLLLSRQGPLGAFELLFTPSAIIAGQFFIVLPILTAFAYGALRPIAWQVRETTITLGARSWQAFVTTLVEARHGITASLLAGFGRIISEVGCALIVGGNIAGYTRTIPTAIALDTNQGQFVQGIALGIVLLMLAITSSLLLFWYQRHRIHQS